MRICELNYLYAEDTCEERETAFPEDYRSVRNYVFAKLINTERNLELLCGAPNEPVFDLSLVTYLFRDDDPDKDEILVTQEMLDSWGVDQEQMFRDAMMNTRSLMGESLRPLKDVISELMKKMNLSMEDDGEDKMPMYVLTNLWKRNGAVCLLYEDSLMELADMLNNDLYVIPSSVHEVILVPMNRGISRRELDHVIKEINESELAPEDVLSDHTYVFLRKISRVTL